MQTPASMFRFYRLGFMVLGYHSYLKPQTMVARVFKGLFFVAFLNNILTPFAGKRITSMRMKQSQ
jgi:hypothetical protein